MDSRVVMSRMDYEILRRVHERAVSIGLGDEELSFLMGKRNKYFFDLLDPTDKDKLKTEQLDVLPVILGVGIRDLVPNEISPGEDVIIYGYKRVTATKIVYRHCVRYHNGQESGTVVWSKRVIRGVRRKLNLVLHKAVVEFLDEGYFDVHRSALELYIELNAAGLVFTPSDLQKSLSVLMNRKRSLPVSLKCESLHSRYYYIRA